MANQLQSQSGRQAVNTLYKLLQHNPGMLERSRFRNPTNKLEKIDLLDRLRKTEIESHMFKDIGLNTYLIIDSYNPDLKAFCQYMIMENS